jgi:polyadenylate-binding protein
VDNKALYDTFSLFGSILSVKVAVNERGKSLGYGFVHYEHAESAKSAIEKVNRMQIGDRTVYVGEFLPKSERDKLKSKEPSEKKEIKYTNIYVKLMLQNFFWLRRVFEYVFWKPFL